MRSRNKTARLPAVAAAALLLVLLTAGCITTVSTAEETQSPQERATELKAQLLAEVQYFKENAGYLAGLIHGGINDKRRENGLPSLTWDPQLANIALSHSRDMAERGYFDHLSPEGEDFADRYDKYNYSKDTRIGNQVYIGGENLFLSNVVESYTYNENTGEVFEYKFYSLEELARSTVDGWMDSPGHRENILTPFSREGIGIYVTDEGEVYITENFS